MGLLDKLWDDTVAGPRPDDTGLDRLRKLVARPAAVKINDPAGEAASSSPFVPPPSPSPSPASGGQETPVVKVTRSIMIKRPAAGGYPASPRSAANTPPASSPAGSTPPISPFSGSGGHFRRKPSSNT